MSPGGTLDVIIIGAGPAGLAAAIYTGRARLDTLVLEKAIPGGQILTTHWIENYPGFPDGIAPFELVENFRKQAEKFGAVFETEQVASLRDEENLWVVRGPDREFRTRAVIIATGAAYRKLGVPNEERLTGRGVSYCAACDGAFFRDETVAVVGGGDNALTEAVFLTKFAKKLYVIHRRNRFRAIKILQERIFASPNVEVLWDSVVEAAQGDTRLERVSLRNLRENRSYEMPLDGLFISIGMDPHSEFVKGLVDLNEWREIKVTPRMATSRKGIFAAGDVADACPKQVAVAAGAGVAAALAAVDYLETFTG